MIYHKQYRNQLEELSIDPTAYCAGAFANDE